jgi:hypothetical protein
VSVLRPVWIPVRDHEGGYAAMPVQGVGRVSRLLLARSHHGDYEPNQAGGHQKQHPMPQAQPEHAELLVMPQPEATGIFV